MMTIVVAGSDGAQIRQIKMTEAGRIGGVVFARSRILTVLKGETPVCGKGRALRCKLVAPQGAFPRFRNEDGGTLPLLRSRQPMLRGFAFPTRYATGTCPPL